MCVDSYHPNTHNYFYVNRISENIYEKMVIPVDYKEKNWMAVSFEFYEYFKD